MITLGYDLFFGAIGLIAIVMGVWLVGWVLWKAWPVAVALAVIAFLVLTIH